MADLEKEERQKAEHQNTIVNGEMTFNDALAAYKQRLSMDGSLKPRSKVYREERIAALLKSWPAIKNADVRKIGKNDCLAWATSFAKTAAPSNFNNTVGTLRLILDIAVEAGLRYPSLITYSYSLNFEHEGVMNGLNFDVSWPTKVREITENLKVLFISAKFIPHDSEITGGVAILTVNGIRMRFQIPNQKAYPPPRGLGTGAGDSGFSFIATNGTVAPQGYWEKTFIPSSKNTVK